ncbi:MAG: lipoprotein [Thauera sp.]|uniref:LPS translocon maturation chaperone LptM n=1 Tax=Thauera sp. JM12B12 TaxID=3142262 RepID=UPI0029C38722|nr:lipoprotein [Thauera sp.]
MRAKLPLIALVCALLSACGIKGPLYLPAPGTTAPPAAGADHSKPVVPPDLLSDTPLE